MLIFPLRIGNKGRITTDILSPICDLETKTLYLNIFVSKGSGANPPNKVENRQSSTVNCFNGRYNVCIDEKISTINFKDRRLLLNECHELVFKCRHKNEFKLSWLGATEAPTLENSWDIDAGLFLLEILTFF